MGVNTGDGGAAHEFAGGLLALRNARKLTTRALGKAAGVSAANISHWERAERLPPEEKLITLLDVLEAGADERDRLVGLRRQAETRGHLAAGTTSIGPELTKLIEYENAATKITDVAPLVIPGLLQDRGYARAVLEEHPDLENRVTLRLGRRDVLTRARNPARLSAFIDSEVLIRPVGTPDVMADQLRHLLAMGELPNVSIRLVPSTTQGYNPMLAGPFILFEFPTAPAVVHAEHWEASVNIWDKAAMARFLIACERIDQIAMTPAESARVIESIVNGMETT